jgi:hypothetical protein
VTIAPVCQDIQSNCEPANDTHTSSRLTPSVISVAPSQSMLTSRLSVGRCSVRWRTIRATTAIGTPT